MTVQVDNLHFAYGEHDVLEDICFGATASQLVAVLGRNGSGKTTLLKTIDRILIPDRGCVLVDGEAVGAMNRREIARRIGYMPQAQQAVHCTVFEAVLLGRKARSGGEPDAHDLEKVEEILRLVRLEELAMRPTYELSGGELQKTILGRALVQEPQVLLLDEPISHLDPVNQIEVMSLLHEVTKGMGITSLLVTHDLNSALRFADRFIMLKDGRVFAAGGKEVITQQSMKAVFGIDCIIEQVAGVPVLVPLLKEVRLHQHIHTHEHEHRNGHEHTHGEPPHEGSDGREHAHPHAHSHSHEVDAHVYDHRHDGDHPHPEKAP